MSTDAVSPLPCSYLNGYTLLGSVDSARVLAVDPSGRIGTLSTGFGPKSLERVLFDPGAHAAAGAPTASKCGLLGGYLPAIDFGFFNEDHRRGWEQLAFVDPAASGPDPVLLVAVCPLEGTRKMPRAYLRIGPAIEPISAAVYFGQLLRLKRFWDTQFERGMQIGVPEDRVVDACRAALVQAMISYQGNKPRYGAGHYALDQHATFPPTTISMVGACVEWGQFERARLYLDHYLDRVLRADGTFDYYGPAVSEYGQLLDVVTQYVRRTGETGWLSSHLPKIQAVIARQRRLRAESLAEYPDTDPHHGLIQGSPEADTREEVDFYYSGNVWTWRGWTEIGHLLKDSEDSEWAQYGTDLLADCKIYADDIEASLERSLRPTSSGVFVPPVAGFHQPFRTMTQDRFASYTNYRYWVEMLSADFLTPLRRAEIIEYRQAHGGELLGTTRFSDHLDDWPYAGYAYGLLLDDRVRPFLLGYYGDLSAHRLRGTFTAYEQVAIRGLAERSYVADYCVPAQLVTALATRWMLVFEERDGDVLWLCRATPRRWLGPDGGVTVHRAPTRWGAVSFHITPIGHETLDAEIKLVPRGGRLPGELRLRLRVPGQRTIEQVTLNNHAHVDFEPGTATIRIPHPDRETLHLHVDLGNSKLAP